MVQQKFGDVEMTLVSSHMHRRDLGQGAHMKEGVLEMRREEQVSASAQKQAHNPEMACHDPQEKGTGPRIRALVDHTVRRLKQGGKHIHAYKRM